MTDVDISWGGYYAKRSEDSNAFSVFRLLDFNREAYHVSIFAEEFSELPSLTEVTPLFPFIGHAPLAVRGWLNAPMYLIGSVALEDADLEGYRMYLDEMEASDVHLQELTARIIGLSQRPPMKLRFGIRNDELVIEARDE